MIKQDCGNASIVEEDIDATIVSRSKSGEDNPQIGLNISILSCSQLSKVTKHCQANTTSLWKQGKFDVETIAKVKDVLGADERGQITLLQYALTAPIVRKLDRLQSRNKQGKVV